jgi:hypothetical protein
MSALQEFFVSLAMIDAPSKYKRRMLMGLELENDEVAVADMTSLLTNPTIGNLPSIALTSIYFRVERL